MFKYRAGGGEGVSQGDIWGKSTFGRGNSQCRSGEKEQQEASVVKAERVSWKTGRCSQIGEGARAGKALLTALPRTLLLLWETSMMACGQLGAEMFSEEHSGCCVVKPEEV